jgi:hypothetical protein
MKRDVRKTMRKQGKKGNLVKAEKILEATLNSGTYG